jgi:hypothetical protein
LRNPHQPFARPLDGGAVLPITQEHLLRDVLRLARIAKQGRGQTVDGAIVQHHGEPESPRREHTAAFR